MKNKSITIDSFTPEEIKQVTFLTFVFLSLSMWVCSIFSIIIMGKYVTLVNYGYVRILGSITAMIIFGNAAIKYRKRIKMVNKKFFEQISAIQKIK